MAIQFTIKSINEDTGNIEVNYFDTDIWPEGINLNVPIPIENGTYPSTERVMEIISQHAPTNMFDIKRAKLSSNLSLSHLEALKDVSHAITILQSSIVEPLVRPTRPTVHSVEII